MRERVERCFTGRADDPVMRVLAQVVDRYGIPRMELEALIHGVEMDLRVSRYQSWEDLQTYCRHRSRRSFWRREDRVDVLVNRVEAALLFLVARRARPPRTSG